jgi:ribonuclease P protein component
MGSFRFPKSERINKDKEIKELFDKGSSFYLHPCKVIYWQMPAGSSSKILVSVSKRNFKKAVQRNRIKRQLREAWRLNRHLLTNARFSIVYIYSAKELLPSAVVAAQMQKILKRINEVTKPAS